MSQRSTPLVSDEPFHIYNRGVNKQTIFTCQRDYHRFIELLYLTNTINPVSIRDIERTYENVFLYKPKNSLVKVHAVCLMPNHYHILASAKADGGLTKFMQKLATGYSMYFNKKYDRTGTLFEGRFKAKHADSDEYLKYLFSYIHLNPVDRTRPDAFTSAIQYPYSTFGYYLPFPRPGLGKGDIPEVPWEQIVDRSLLKMYLPTRAHQKREIFDWLTYEVDAD